MPQDLSSQLTLQFWGLWFFEQMHHTPHLRDSWNSHCRDTLEMFQMGGEL